MNGNLHLRCAVLGQLRTLTKAEGTADTPISDATAFTAAVFCVICEICGLLFSVSTEA
jgi:hypothetical protein